MQAVCLATLKLMSAARLEDFYIGGSFTSEDLLQWRIFYFGGDCGDVKQQGENEDDELTIEEETVLFKNAHRAWSTAQKFMQLRSGILGVMQACDHLEDEMRRTAKRTCAS